MHTIDYKQRLLAEVEDLPPDELERIYKMVVFVRDQFIDMSGEERYYTESWIEAEREATEAYSRGGLKRFKSVQEMADYIEAGIEAREAE
jgi:hypothetical protein